MFSLFSLPFEECIIVLHAIKKESGRHRDLVEDGDVLSHDERFPAVFLPQDRLSSPFHKIQIILSNCLIISKSLWFSRSVFSFTVTRSQCEKEFASFCSPISPSHLSLSFLSTTWSTTAQVLGESTASSPSHSLFPLQHLWLIEIKFFSCVRSPLHSTLCLLTTCLSVYKFNQDKESESNSFSGNRLVDIVLSVRATSLRIPFLLFFYPLSECQSADPIFSISCLSCPFARFLQLEVSWSLRVHHLESRKSISPLLFLLKHHQFTPQETPSSTSLSNIIMRKTLLRMPCSLLILAVTLAMSSSSPSYYGYPAALSHAYATPHEYYHEAPAYHHVSLAFIACQSFAWFCRLFDLHELSFPPHVIKCKRIVRK